MEGFDSSVKKFSVPKSLQTCSAKSYTKVKFTDETWYVKFDEDEDRNLFIKVLNRGLSLHGRPLRARNWVFLYTPKELWEEVERLADAANQIYHEDLGGAGNSQQNTQSGLNNKSKKND